MAAVAVPAAHVADPNIARQQLIDLRKEYQSKLYTKDPRPYFAIAALVASTAMMIFGSFPMALFGALVWIFGMQLQRLSPEQAEANRTNQLVLDRLAVPGFFEFCRTDARTFQNAVTINEAFGRFLAAPRPL